MISVKTTLLGLFFAFNAFGAGEEFLETAPLAPGASSEIQTATVGQLKQQAVTNRLREMIGKDRFSAVEKQVTREFADKYITDYKPRRVGPQRDQLELSGHLDIDGLKRWVRLADVKSKGSQSQGNLFILSSAVPGFSFGPGETTPKVRESAVAKEILAAMTSAFQKLNQKVFVADVSKLGNGAPPRSQNDIKSFSEQLAGTQGGAVWVNLIACKSCGGMRLDTHVYSIAKARSVLLRSDDLAMNPTELTNATKFKGLLKNVISGLQADLEETVSAGKFMSQAMEVNIDGLVSYPAFKSVREQLERLDYLNQFTMVRAEPRSATFEALSPLTPEELATRLSQESFSGFQLKTQSVDSRALSMRYSQ